MLRQMAMTPPTTAVRKLCNIQEAQSRLGVSRRTIERLIEDGALKSVKIRARVMIPDQELERVFNEGSP